MNSYTLRSHGIEATVIEDLETWTGVVRNEELSRSYTSRPFWRESYDIVVHLAMTSTLQDRAALICQTVVFLATELPQRGHSLARREAIATIKVASP